MKIGLIDVDGHNFPNFALMKTSAPPRYTSGISRAGAISAKFSKLATSWSISRARISNAQSILTYQIFCKYETARFTRIPKTYG